MSAQTRQMIGSLLVAVAIVAACVIAVTAKLGPTSVAELEAQEERLEERQELEEERLEERRDRREEPTGERERRETDEGGRGRGRGGDRE